MKRFVITCGDINGIGPEICVKLLNEISTNTAARFIFAAPSNISDYQKLECEHDIVTTDDELADSSSRVSIYSIGEYEPGYGKPTKQSGEASGKAITKAVELTKQGKADAILTAPISKKAWELAGVTYPGHTELFADTYDADNFVMMFLSDELKTALITIHEPLSMVPRLITIERIVNTVKTVHQTLRIDFGIEEPKIALLGLNPHAGEQGRIGREEIEIINPALHELQKKYNIAGPFVPDAYWGMKRFKDYDCTLGMYHDQALIPFKLMAFDRGVNYTAGLPVVRTSPDHGTAYDIAGKGTADHNSLKYAYKYADHILSNRMIYHNG